MMKSASREHGLIDLAWWREQQVEAELYNVAKEKF